MACSCHLLLIIFCFQQSASDPPHVERSYRKILSFIDIKIVQDDEVNKADCCQNMEGSVTHVRAQL